MFVHVCTSDVRVRYGCIVSHLCQDRCIAVEGRIAGYGVVFDDAAIGSVS